MEEKETTVGIVGIDGASLTIGKLATALAKTQGQMKSAVKDSENPFFKSRYADLASVWEACREPLAKNGIAVIQRTTHTDGTIINLDTILIHESGEWIKGSLNMRPVKNDPQGLGSCLTYARRYGLSAMVGICPEDDDGNKASGAGGTADVGKPATPQEKHHAAGMDTKQDGPKTATGIIMDRKGPNAGGFVQYAIKGYFKENGKPMYFSTKIPMDIETLDGHKNAGEETTIEYKDNENPNFAADITGLVVVPF